LTVNSHSSAQKTTIKLQQENKNGVFLKAAAQVKRENTKTIRGEMFEVGCNEELLLAASCLAEGNCLPLCRDKNRGKLAQTGKTLF
jgi:hypothetical protein